MQTTGEKVQEPRQGPVLSEAFMGQARRAAPVSFGDFVPDDEPDEEVLATLGMEFDLEPRQCLVRP